MAGAGLEVSVVERPFAFRSPSVDEALEVFLGAAGPLVQFMETATSLGHGDEAVAEMRAALEEGNEPDDEFGCVLPAPYLLAIAHPVAVV